MMLFFTAIIAAWRGLTKSNPGSSKPQLRSDAQSLVVTSAPRSRSVHSEHSASSTTSVAALTMASISGADEGSATGTQQERRSKSTPEHDNVPSGEQPSESHWAQALAEVEGSGCRPGLWAKCFAEAFGVESIAKAAYLQERAKQLLAAAVELMQEGERQAAKMRELEAFRLKIGQQQAQLFDNLHFIEMNQTVPFKLLKRVLRMLGGNVEWGSTGMLSSGWRVSFLKESRQFPSDQELYYWFRNYVLPHAKNTLSVNISDLRCAKCPNCEAILPIGAPSCLGCDTDFGPESALRPVPISET